MKTVRKILMVLLVCAMIWMLSGCGDKDISVDTNLNEDVEDLVTEDLSTEELESVDENDLLSINDIDWNVKAGSVDGINTIFFGYTNNTNYTIADVEMTFEQKDDVTADQLVVFDSLKEDREWSDEEVAQIYILGYNRKLADPGETVDESPCVINGTYTLVESMEQYEIMEPTEVSIVYIGSDDKMRMVSYDFKTKEYNYSAKSESIHEWSDSDISSLLPKSEARVVKVSSDDKDRFFFYAYGVLEDEYKSYVDACKKNGFTNVEFESDNSYRALNADNYEVKINYILVEETMTGCIEKSSEEDVTEIESQDSESGIQPEFKDMMDSYEAFFDEYCEFMKKYSESDDTTSMLADYTDYMTKYVEFMGKLDEVNEDELSTEEALYYAEVSARISQKLLEVAQ